MSNEIELVYSNDIFEEVTKDKEDNEAELTDIQYIMIQMTSDRRDFKTETANTFYKAKNLKNKKYAHYVIDSRNVVKYLQSIDIPQKNTPFKGDYHNKTMVVELVWNNILDTEKMAVQFLSDFLHNWNLPISCINRRSDMVKEKDIYFSLYNEPKAWSRFVACVNERLKKLNERETYNKKVEKYNKDHDLKPKDFKQSIKNFVPVPVPNNTYPEKVYQPALKGNFFSSSSKKVDAKKVHMAEDYKRDTMLGGKINYFTGEAIREFDKNIEEFEPVYPDLTMPPKGNTNLYANKIYNLKDAKFYTKLTLGDYINRYEPYPVEQKIAELQAHRPKIKIEDGEANGLGESKQWIMALSERTEKRIVQLENTTSVLMRYFNRLSSRVCINCVYYGGQATYYKYRCIRCLNDDLTQDRQIVTLDQCLNCTRYEPIEGQTYDILDDDLQLNLAPIMDDNQMGRVTMHDYIDNVYTQNMREDIPKAEFNFADINKSPEIDNHEKWKQESESEYFEMNWKEIELQDNTPDINDYEYNPSKILENKYDIVDKPRENNLKDIKKIDVQILPDSYNIIRSDGVSGIGGMMYASDVRLKIVHRAKELFKMNKEGKAGYSMSPIKRKKVVNGVLYLDCSSLVNDCYKKAGLPHAGGDTTYNIKEYFFKARKGFTTKDVSKAKPGDIVLWDGHAAIYIGDEMIIDASTGKGLLTENYKHRRYDALKGKNFLGFCRTEELISADKVSTNTGIASQSIMEAVNKYGDRVDDWKRCLKNMEKWKYRDILLVECMRQNMDPYLMLGLATRETGGDPTVKGSARNPYNGLFQVKGGDYSGTKQGIISNVKQGINHYNKMKKLTESKFKVNNANPLLTMYCYNSGPGNVYPWLDFSKLASRANVISPIQMVEAIRNGYPKKPIRGDVGGITSRSMYGTMVLYYAEQFKSQKIFS